MTRKLIISIVGFLALVALLWQLGYFGIETNLESLVPRLQSGDSLPHAQAWALFDIQTGGVIRGEASDAVLPIASITKLFTAYAAEASESLEKETWINWNDLYTEGRSGKLRHGDYLSVRELLFPLLLESSNDAGTAVGRVLGSTYQQEVDALSETLALSDTHIVDPTGLDPRNVSSAEELAAFFAYLKRHHPLVTDITQLRMYIEDDRGLVNNNPARDVAGFAGGKHGYLPEAGKTFVGSFTLDSGEEIGVVLLHTDDIVRDIRAVLAYASKLSLGDI